MKTHDLKTFTTISFILASSILAYHPLIWLIKSWFDISYQSTGAFYVIGIAVLIAWSASSPVLKTTYHHHQSAVLLLLLSALIRLASQVLAINFIGGIALALDVFAILTLLQMPNRKRSVSAFWLSVLFLFTLPVERILQRILGYPLQEFSAAGACNLLGLMFDDLTCEGVRIQVANQDVLVDLPCSGTVGLMLSMAFMVALNALYRPRLSVAALWFIIAAILSVLGNALRISLLAAGLVHQEALGIDVMAQPTHDLLGYLTIGLSFLPILIFYNPKPVATHSWFKLPKIQLPQYLKSGLGIIFVVFAITIITLPRHAIDVSKKLEPINLPISLNGEFGITQPLAEIEKSYFEQYGGQAQKVKYGPYALTMVHTTSPLRHLHSPDDCLRGLGYQVEFLGTRFSPIPTALYKATGQDGQVWRVSITYASDTGHTTSSIAEAIWLWFKNPKTKWSSIQRITPWEMPNNQRQTYEAAMGASLDMASQI